MEQHGEIQQKLVIAIIPARYASTRLPSKMLLNIGGKPLILHTLAQTQKAKTVSRVIVATDDKRIFDVVTENGGEAVMTSPDHASGTDRLAEVAIGLPEGSIIVNVQGDEPMISPETIDRAVNSMLDDPDADMATVCEPITSIHGELLNGNVVKVVVGDEGYAVFFSRSPMPFPRDAALRHGGDPGRALEAEPELMANFRKHTGLYVYRRAYLLRFSVIPPTRLERIESLEQLRAVEDGALIRVVEAVGGSIAVDTDQDLARVRIMVEEMPISVREADENDIAEVSRVYVEAVRRSFECVYPDDYLAELSAERREAIVRERFSRANYRLVVAESATGKLVGFVDSGIPVLDGFSHDRQIFSIYLLPEYQRLGVGRELFRACVSKLIEDGAKTICLDTVEASPYRRFYDRLGGKIVGNSMHKFGDTEMETVIYQWDDQQTI